MADLLEDLKEAFRGVMLRDLRPVEDKDGVRIGEDVRISKEKDGGYLVRFLKDTKELRKKAIRDSLSAKNIKFKEGKDYKD